MYIETHKDQQVWEEYKCRREKKWLSYTKSTAVQGCKVLVDNNRMLYQASSLPSTRKIALFGT